MKDEVNQCLSCLQQHEDEQVFQIISLKIDEKTEEIEDKLTEWKHK